MIIKDRKEITERYWGIRPIAYVYRGIQLIWSAISSCFGSGMWLNNKPWSNDDAWKN